MWHTETLSYPWIMADRQIQSLRECTFGDPTFETPTYGFRFSVPSEYCILPHRIFPDDSSLQIVPKAFYFSLNEYISGSVSRVSRGSVLFERTSDGRTIPAVMDALRMGGFLASATTSEYTNPSGVTFTVVRHATGIVEGKYFDWAFAENRDGTILLSLLSQEEVTPSIFETLLDGIEKL
jgi:hypothetical protein